jgi:hypothetical protein
MHQAQIEKLQFFRKSIYSCFKKRADATFNLLDALSSSGHECKSVVELSESPAFLRQYSSITDAIGDGLPHASLDKTASLVYHAVNSGCVRTTFFLDCTGNPRPWAKKLDGRCIVHAPNPAPGNKPICVGRQYSVLAIAPMSQEARLKHWLLPIKVDLVDIEEKGHEVGMKQLVKQIETLSLKDELSISVGDSLYATEGCRQVVAEHPNIVHIFRLKSQRAIYKSPSLEELAHTGAGRKKQYGHKMLLSDKKTHALPDKESSFMIEGKKQVLTVKLTQWNSLLLRGSRDFPSHRHPINVLRIIICDAQGEPVFKRPLWLGIMGKRRHEITMEEIYETYRQRYDIEHFFRFGKQNLLLDSYQTPDAEHEKLWWQFAPLAYVQLYLAAQLGQLTPKPWERYLKAYQNENPQDNVSFKTPAQTQRTFSKLLNEIGTPARDCIPRGKPVGRKAGEQPIERSNHAIYFKGNKETNSIKNEINTSQENQKNQANDDSIEKLLNKVRSELKKKGFSPADFAEKLLL